MMESQFFLPVTRTCYSLLALGAHLLSGRINNPG